MEITIIFGVDAPAQGLILKNIRVVDGHDDSLPYKANLYFKKKKIALLHNDGWGGDTYITPTDDESAELLKQLNVWVDTNYAFEFEDNKGVINQYPLDMGYILDAAVSECLNRGRSYNMVNITRIDGVGRKKKGE